MTDCRRLLIAGGYEHRAQFLCRARGVKVLGVGRGIRQRLSVGGVLPRLANRVPLTIPSPWAIAHSTEGIPRRPPRSQDIAAEEIPKSTPDHYSTEHPRRHPAIRHRRSHAHPHTGSAATPRIAIRTAVAAGWHKGYAVTHTCNCALHQHMTPKATSTHDSEDGARTRVPRPMRQDP